MAACGEDFTVAVTEDGELLACGQGGQGQLGLGAVLHQQQPARAGGPEMFGNQRIRLAAAGDRHLAVVVEDGAVYTCGDGYNGRLGRRRAAAAAADAGAAGAVCGLARRHGVLRLLAHDGGDGGGARVDLRLQRSRPAGRGRQDRQAGVHAGGCRAARGREDRDGRVRIGISTARGISTASTPGGPF